MCVDLSIHSDTGNIHLDDPNKLKPNRLSKVCVHEEGEGSDTQNHTKLQYSILVKNGF